MYMRHTRYHVLTRAHSFAKMNDGSRTVHAKHVFITLVKKLREEEPDVKSRDGRITRRKVKLIVYE